MDGDKYKFSLKLFQLFIYLNNYLIIQLFIYYVCAMVHMYRPENNLWELALSFYQHKGAYITELHELCIFSEVKVTCTVYCVMVKKYLHSEVNLKV